MMFSRVQKHHPEEFGFVPKTWILPADHSLLQNYAKDLKSKKKYKTFIVKPSNGAQGHGYVDISTGLYQRPQISKEIIHLSRI